MITFTLTEKDIVIEISESGFMTAYKIGDKRLPLAIKNRSFAKGIIDLLLENPNE